MNWKGRVVRVLHVQSYCFTMVWFEKSRIMYFTKLYKFVL